MTEHLKPCPFCGGTETQVREALFWTGMRNDVVSVTVMHWCERNEGQPQSHLEIKGRDRESAVRMWNERTNGEDHAHDRQTTDR